MLKRLIRFIFPASANKENKEATEKLFVSLKWKYGFIISFVLLCLYATISFSLYSNAKTLYNEELQNQTNELFNSLDDLILQSTQTMEQFVDSISQLKQKNTSTMASAEKQLINTVDQNWLSWKFIWGLEGLSYYHHEGNYVSQWGRRNTDLSALFEKVIDTEHPQHIIDCYHQCVIYVAVPIQSKGKIMGVMSVGKEISDTLINFSKINKVDIGLVINNEILAVTNNKINRTLLQSFLFYKQKAVNDSDNDSGNEMSDYSVLSYHRISINSFVYHNQHYSLSLSDVNKNNKEAYFIIIDNHEADFRELKNERNIIIFMGVISLFMTIIMLFLLLGKTLTKVNYLSQALPYLAKDNRLDQNSEQGNKFQKIQSLLSTIKSQKYTYDELDELKSTTLNLSYQLEKLEDNISQNTLQIKNKNIELKNERDFVHQLIETAPIYIITQAYDGQILSANQQCSQLSPLNHEDIIGKNFIKLFVKNNSEHESYLRNFYQINEGETISIDDELLVGTSSIRNISWLHTHIQSEQSIPEEKILSLGIDITERKVAEEQTIWLASHDPLTHLHNRHYFQLEFEKLLLTAQQYQKKLALFFLDLDQFKVVNDTQGHTTGDKLLMDVAMVLQALCQPSDLLCRLGGDEFAIVTSMTDINDVISLANKINHSFQKIVVSDLHQSYQLSSSIGIVLYPDNGTTIQDLQSNADLAMYHAKETGVNHYHIYDSNNSYHQELNERLKWKQLIKYAISHNRLILYYQPILDLQENTISHYECLLRILKDDGSLLAPAKFIKYAEELGLIEIIDKMVINLAINKLYNLQQNGRNNIKLAINLSGRSINNDNVKAEIKKLLNQPEVISNNIIFEITETSAVSNFKTAQSFINEIRELGCQIALDDFGSGFSSFYYLKNMSFDYIKIDGAFIQRIEHDKEDKIFVKALSDVARALGKKTIAEFVETESSINILRELHVDYAQGYYISKPLADII